MALEVVGGAFLSSFLNVLFDRMASRQVVDFICGQKLTNGLLKKLKIKLLSVNGVLGDAEEKQIRNPAVREWLDELRDALYAAEELLDEIKTEALRRKVEAEPGSGSSSSASQVWNLNCASFDEFDKTIEPKIVEILDRLELIVNEKDVLGLREGVKDRPHKRLPATSLVEEDGVYGRDEDKETIVEVLVSEITSGNKISVIPIVGMGGIGKTTLAQLVYNNVRVKQYFDLQAWVCVSEDFDVVRITRTIYESITSQTCGITDLNLLQVKLKEALTGKKFFFVHDDVWNENYIDWDILKRPFESGAHGSKIIVTTRNEGVASVMGTLPTHRLMQISEKDCWLLFRQHAFESAGASAHPNFEVIGRRIARKCKGLPLAAKSLGGLLRSELNLEEWENILESDVWELSDKESNIMPALWLSYHYLPSHLKRCFAYCSIFPKDYKFTKSELVLLWMAEDLVQSKNKKMVEEVGESHFNDLISRSFFQPSSGCDQLVFTMHDLINDLAKFVSGYFCFRLEHNDSLNIVRKTRHFSYMKTEGYGVEKFEALYEAKHLHTFLPLSPRHQMVPRFKVFDKVLLDLLPTLECLRVLNLSNYDIRELPNSIGNLKHLRHLNLSYTSIEKLPDSVCTLYNLQTLLLSDCQALTQLPTNLGRLINLRHLVTSGTYLAEMPLRMGKLKDLQTLSKFVLDKHTGCSIVELKGSSTFAGNTSYFKAS